MWFQIIFVIGLAIVHLTAGNIRFLQAWPRSAWLSFAGGIAVSYVFVHVFPELEEAQQAIGGHGTVAFLEHHAYLIALVGLILFYGLEHWVSQNKAQTSPPNTEAHALPGKRMFWLHIGTFALYNALVGYLLVYRESSLHELALYALAMAFHFLVNDYGLVARHREYYLRKGRWVLAVAVIIGWCAGQWIEVEEAATSMLFAFLAGGVVLNVLKEELPEERQSRLWPFVLGAVLYSLLLLVI
ncbi:hypothetical protein [Vreelandella nanhaiensis]|uniref:ZIP Zinc transporter n=1 Tax=Vreelandella nanhaiensis TaxID=1258546 RepID=A0A433KV69_9GAMM|nr:hypothetical protein [Halomonas nanhaiensis]RUR33532.1 hypothetical protein ELY38_03625 [Halomonas nanhaiensis]